MAISDPLEAEALYEHFLANSQNPKLRRAAVYELFFLRLRQQRFAAAFRQAENSPFAQHYHKSLAASLGLKLNMAKLLVSKLRKSCDDSQKIFDLQQLLRNGYPISAWDFALQVLHDCGMEDPTLLFPEEIFSEEESDITPRNIQLQLLAAREQIATAPETAAQLLVRARNDIEVNFPDDHKLQLQLLSLEAQLALHWQDYAMAIAKCQKVRGNAKVSRACRFIRAYALLKLQEPHKAWQEIVKIQLQPWELDYRLLKIIVGVAAGQIPEESLQQFRRRLSYTQCARELRELANQLSGD
ncbi:MAG: hypothetical protein N2Z22_11225 [Turneriella sp.]|nr:hypothetical protein [Turneriella sp.]